MPSIFRKHIHKDTYRFIISSTTIFNQANLQVKFLPRTTQQVHSSSTIFTDTKSLLQQSVLIPFGAKSFL